MQLHSTSCCQLAECRQHWRRCSALTLRLNTTSHPLLGGSADAQAQPSDIKPRGVTFQPRMKSCDLKRERLMLSRLSCRHAARNSSGRFTDDLLALYDLRRGMWSSEHVMPHERRHFHIYCWDLKHSSACGSWCAVIHVANHPFFGVGIINKRECCYRMVFIPCERTE